MRRLAMIFLALMALPGLAHGQTVTVRGGEHEGFTRLVLDLPRQSDWSLDRSADEAVLQLAQQGLRFDLSTAFSRIGRERLAALSSLPGQSALKLDLACKCDIKTHLHNTRMLVIDLVDRKTPMTRPEPAAMSHPPALVSPPPQATMPRMDDRLRRLARVRTAQDRLLEQLSRAASQGLLTPRRTLPNQPARDKPEPAPPPAAEPPGEAGNQINLRAQSSIDHDLALFPRPDPLNAEGGRCLPDADLAVQDWGGTGGFSAWLSHARPALFAESARIDPEGALTLAAGYIHYSFGAEALAILDLPEMAPEVSRPLRAMAAILEFGHEGAGEVFAHQASCDSAVAFWSVLAARNPADVGPINAPAALRTLNGLPAHLRAYLGPMLSDRLLDAGKSDSARAALRIVARSSASPRAEQKMSEARMALKQGTHQSAEQMLREVVASNSESAPEALAHLIDSRLAREKPLSPEIADLAAAYAQEMRDQPLAPQLRRVHILALADTARFSEAFEEIETLRSAEVPEVLNRALTETAAILTRKADDFTFLTYALNANAMPPGKVKAQTAHRIARRLLETGFAEQAGTFLQSEAPGRLRRERRLLRAEIALAQRHPRRARAEVVGLQDEDSALIRARSNFLSGDYQLAHEEFRALNREDQALTAAWLAENWAYLAQSDDPILADIGALIAAGASTDATPIAPPDNAGNPLPAEGILARDHRLLEQSQATRARLAALLNRSWPAAESAPDS